jgi:hypothetical protein
LEDRLNLEEQYISGEVIVGVRPDSFVRAKGILTDQLRSFGGTIVDSFPQVSALKVQVPEGDERAFIRSAESEETVLFAEPNYLYWMLETPSDPYWEKQWGPQKINIDKAWQIEKGRKDIVVAIVDTGIDYTHLDLAANCLDTGVDFVDSDKDPMDGVGHGTHVAGIVSATANNGLGIAGLANVAILPVRVLNNFGFGNSWDIAQGIVWAAEKGAQIINISLGSYQTSKVLHTAVKHAYERGCLIVAAAGNGATDKEHYPSAYEEVIAVSATDKDDQLATFSNYGPAIELAAPGVNILATFPLQLSASFSGTSMAAPHVCGVAALVWSMNPNLTNEQVRTLLRESAVDLGPEGRDDQFGYGRIDAYRALQKAKGEIDHEPAVQSDLGQQVITLEVRTSSGEERRYYRVGESLSVLYRAKETADVTIYRISEASAPELLYEGRISADFPRTIDITASSHAMIETIVALARTDAGQVSTVVRSYSVGRKMESWIDLSLDRGDGNVYQIGDLITISCTPQEDCEVQLFDFPTAGRPVELFTRSMEAGKTVSLNARISGPVGEEALVIRAVNRSGEVVTAARVFLIKE